MILSNEHYPILNFNFTTVKASIHKSDFQFKILIQKRLFTRPNHNSFNQSSSITNSNQSLDL